MATLFEAPTVPVNALGITVLSDLHLFFSVSWHQKTKTDNLLVLPYFCWTRAEDWYLSQHIDCSPDRWLTVHDSVASYPMIATALDRDMAHSKPVIRHSKFPVSPACHNRVTWLATSAQLLPLLAVVRIKLLCQAPPPWHHNAISCWCHIQNIESFRNVESDTLSNIKKATNFVFLTSWDKNKTVKLCDAVHPRGISGHTFPNCQIFTTMWCLYVRCMSLVRDSDFMLWPISTRNRITTELLTVTVP